MSEVVMPMVTEIKDEVGAEPEEFDATVVGAGRSDRGMVSAEWAVGLIAAIAIAGVLLAVVTNGAVKTGILKFILIVINAFSGGIGSL